MDGILPRVARSETSTRFYDNSIVGDCSNEAEVLKEDTINPQYDEKQQSEAVAKALEFVDELSLQAIEFEHQFDDSAPI